MLSRRDGEWPKHLAVKLRDDMMLGMRTTVTLDSDAEALLRERMRQRGVSFKQALNDAVRESARVTNGPATPFKTPTFELGIPSVNLDRALQVASELEDDEAVRKLRLGK